MSLLFLAALATLAFVCALVLGWRSRSVPFGRVLLGVSLVAAVPVLAYLLFVGSVAYKDHEARVSGPDKSRQALARIKKLAAPLGFAPETLLKESSAYSGYPEYRARAELEFTTALGLEEFTRKTASAFPALEAQQAYDTHEVRRQSRSKPGVYLWYFGQAGQTETVDVSFDDKAAPRRVHLLYRAL